MCTANLSLSRLPSPLYLCYGRSRNTVFILDTHAHNYKFRVISHKGVRGNRDFGGGLVIVAHVWCHGVGRLWRSVEHGLGFSGLLNVTA